MKRIAVAMSLVLFVSSANGAFSQVNPTVEWASYSGLSLRAMTVDEDGNVYVTGGTGLSMWTPNSCVTIKYNNTGEQLWKAVYKGEGYNLDIGMRICVDGSRNVIVTEWGYGNVVNIIKYDQNGNQVWVRDVSSGSYPPDEPSGTGSECYCRWNGWEYAVGYCQDWGEMNWKHRFGVSPEGYPVVARAYWEVFKFDLSGNIVRALDGLPEGASYSRAWCVDFDYQGNIYVGGFWFPLPWGSGSKGVLIKYDPNGDMVWHSEFGPINQGYIAFFALKVGLDQSIYVTGEADSFGTGSDRITLKYDPNGSLLWWKRYDGGDNEHASDIALDRAGNVYVTGSNSNTMLKYDGDGNECWAMRFPSQSAPTAIALDSSNNIYVTGDGYTIKYSQTIEVQIDIKPGFSPNSINLGSNGNVPVAILSTSEFNALDIDPLSVTLAGASVLIKGKGTPMASQEDINGDGLLDLVVHVDTEAFQLAFGDVEAVLVGRTYDGQNVRGVDSVRIVQ